MGTQIIDALADFARTTTYEELPQDVVDTTKDFLLDSIGCGLGGITTDPGKIAVSVAKSLGGPAECSILGTGEKVAITNAVLANGQLINALDYDTVMPGGHTPPYVVPTQLAMAERVGASGRDLVLSTAIALEIGARMAGAVPRAMQFVGEKKEFRYAVREGYARLNFGAAAGAGRLAGLDHEQLVNAMALAGHMSQLNTWGRGNYAMPRNLSKYGFPGWQNTGAILSVFYAEMGLMGDAELLDDDEHGYGEFSGYDAWDPSRIAAGIGEQWSFAGAVRFKPYACCTMLHRGVQAFESILAEHRLHPDEIESVVATASPTVESVLFTDRSMNNIVDLQFGMHNVLAMVALGEKTGPDWQDWHKLTDPKVQRFADKVTLLPNPDFGTDGISGVTVTARGEEYHAELAGDTAPMRRDELVEKFRGNAARSLTRTKTDAAIDALIGLEEVDEVRRLTAALTL